MILRASMKKALHVCGVSAAALLLSIYACDNADTAKPPAGPDPDGTDTEAPSVPLNLFAAAASDSSMDVTWSPSTDDVGVEGYRVYRDGSAVGVASSPAYLDTGLAAGTSYSYQVGAFDTSGNESARSSPATGTTSGGSPSGSTYLVGPARTYTSIRQVEALLEPGDLVLVDGDEVYAGGVTFSNAGAPGEPITIRGVKVNGVRPAIEGGNNVVEFNQSNYVFEGFEIRDAGFRGLYHHADNIVIRDCVVHDCPHGILGADEGSGDLTVEYCEIFACGEGDGRHQIYISTNENDYPGSVFRLRFCYIHDGTGGNNVKSRAERNEIYYNWLETPYYHNLELIGPDPAGGVAEDKAREDSDVAGNVLIAQRYSRNVRIGGDGTGQSFGRYRFMNNTFIHRNADPASQIFAHFGVESVEMHNNVFYIASSVRVRRFRGELGARQARKRREQLGPFGRGLPVGVDGDPRRHESRIRRHGRRPAAPRRRFDPHRRGNGDDDESGGIAIPQSARGAALPSAAGGAHPRGSGRASSRRRRHRHRGVRATVEYGRLPQIPGILTRNRFSYRRRCRCAFQPATTRLQRWTAAR